MHLCINIEAEYWKMSLNFRRPNIEKIGSVWELCLLPATLWTHFFVILLLYLILMHLSHPMLEYQTPCEIEINCCRWLIVFFWVKNFWFVKLRNFRQPVYCGYDWFDGTMSNVHPGEYQQILKIYPCSHPLFFKFFHYRFVD